jgi:microcystin-dependent protein
MGNWLLCDGRSVSRTTYSRLFKSIGTTYGSVDVDSFNVPNLRGRVIVGYCDTLPTQAFNYGKWNSDTRVNVGSTGGEYNYLLNQSNVPIAYFNIPTITNLVQDVNVVCAVDGSDYFKFSGDNLSIQHRNWKVVTNVTVGQRSYYGNTNVTINSNNAVSIGNTGGKLPFNILQTDNVSLVNKAGRSAINITQHPSQSNNYTTTVLVDDDGPAGRVWQSFTLRYSAKATTQNVYTAVNTAVAELNTMQPYMAMNYIIKY